MTANNLSSYLDALSGCRFCPMCKPANEVANLTGLESHSTRARAMMLWRIANGLANWTPRQVELLYQTTLDSISQAWCLCHYPVSEYVVAARAEVFAAGLAPAAVRQALERNGFDPRPSKSDALLLGGEASEWGDETVLEPVLRILKRIGVAAEAVCLPVGALPFCLGARSLAEQQARKVAALIRDSGARLLIPDGPQTLWALRHVYAELDVSLPKEVKIVSLSVLLAQARMEGKLSMPDMAGMRAIVHDSRSASLLAESMAQVEAIQPGYRGSEEKLGEGEIYEAPRNLVAAMGIERLYTTWSRSLCRSCGADEGLWLTYPKLAAGLAKQQLQEAKRMGAEILITDSVLCARHLSKFCAEGDAQVVWLPELMATAAPRRLPS